MLDSSFCIDKLTEVLGNIYTGFQLIAGGGNSKVFLAIHQRLRIRVAIKVTIASGSAEKIFRECDILKRLNHEFLPRIFDFFTDEGYSYLIMDYIEGCTLREYIQYKGTPRLETTINWMRCLCQAVQYLHEHDIIHSDIKPANIMITYDEKLKLIDFGVSIFRGETSIQYPIGVSAYYSPPEQYNIPSQVIAQIKDHATQQTILHVAESAHEYGFITTRSDIYSIGATSYFMLTGHAPSLPNKPIIPLSSYQYKIPPPSGLCHIVERCLCPNPNHRFQTVAELNAQLSRYYHIDFRKRHCLFSIGFPLWIKNVTPFRPCLKNATASSK